MNEAIRDRLTGSTSPPAGGQTQTTGTKDRRPGPWGPSDLRDRLHRIEQTYREGDAPKALRGLRAVIGQMTDQEWRLVEQGGEG